MLKRKYKVNENQVVWTVYDSDENPVARIPLNNDLEDVVNYDKKQADLRIKYLESQEKKLQTENDDLKSKLGDYRRTIKALLDYISLKGAN